MKLSVLLLTSSKALEQARVTVRTAIKEKNKIAFSEVKMNDITEEFKQGKLKGFYYASNGKKSDIVYIKDNNLYTKESGIPKTVLDDTQIKEKVLSYEEYLTLVEENNKLKQALRDIKKKTYDHDVYFMIKE